MLISGKMSSFNCTVIPFNRELHDVFMALKDILHHELMIHFSFQFNCDNASHTLIRKHSKRDNSKNEDFEKMRKKFPKNFFLKRTCFCLK